MDASGSWGCEFAADAEQSAAEAEIGVGRVVESVGFEDAALVDGTQGFYRANGGSRSLTGSLISISAWVFRRLGTEKYTSRVIARGAVRRSYAKGAHGEPAYRNACRRLRSETVLSRIVERFSRRAVCFMTEPTTPLMQQYHAR